MKPISFIRLIFFFTAVLTATTGLGQSQENPYTIKGRLLDGETGQPLPFAQVALFEPGAEEPASFTDTNEKGQFILNSKSGSFHLRFILLGYSQTEQPVEVKGNMDLGGVELESENQDLQEVVIQSNKVPIRADVEGITINPEQNLSNIGGTLLDILRNTPSISVSEDGSISLRGSSGTNILINGRNSSLTQNLDQLPASAVEQIKVINNPNARFDAEAAGGVIDIILKRGEDLGTNGGAEFTYGTRGRMNTGIRLNHRTTRYNVYGGYNFRRWQNVGERNSVREIFEDNETLEQNTDSESENLGHTFNYGGEYYLGKNIISYEGVLSTSDDSQINTLFSELKDKTTGDLILDYVRRNHETEADDGMDNALIYERTFDDPDRQFRFTASNSYRNQYKIQNIDIFRNTLNPIPENLDGREQAFTDEKRYISVFQVDYIHPLDEKSKFETGLKSNIRKFDNDYIYSRFEETAQDFVEDPAISNRFIYKDQIHAGYFIYSRTSPKFDYTVGLRGEYTLVDTYLANTDESNVQKYVDFFPSFQSLYKFNEVHGLKLTYSRRIDRPTSWRLNPFPDITDSLNVRRGNPNLQPEMIHSLEFGHLANSDKSSFTTNLFYRHVSGQLDFITTIEDGISYSQPDNLNTAESYGIEFIGLSEISPWWTLSGGLTMFQIRVDGSNIGEEFVNSGFAWDTKITSDFKLPWNFNFQLVGDYESAEVEAQGRDLSQYSLDASIQKSFLNKKGNVSVSLRDVFDTRRFAGNSLTNSFSQTFYAKRETRILMMSARYSF
ncbi:MAG: outer membrane beta-barrel family protein [Anditalea sp.]